MTIVSKIEMKAKLLKSFLTRLENSKKDTFFGSVFGALNEEKDVIVALSYTIPVEGTKSLVQLPAPPFALIYKGKCENLPELREIIKGEVDGKGLSPSDLTVLTDFWDLLLLLTYVQSTKSLKAYTVTQSLEITDEIPIEIVSDANIYADFALLHLNAAWDYSGSLQSAAIDDIFGKISENDILFQIGENDDTRFIVGPTTTSKINLECKVYHNIKDVEITPVTMFHKITDTTKQTFLFEAQFENVDCATGSVVLNFVVMVPRESSCSMFYTLLNAVYKNLKQVKKTNTAWIGKSFKTYHFYPKELGHFVTISYPDDVSENEYELIKMRQELHELFDLPVSGPIFRKCNSYKFGQLEINNDRNPSLANVHSGLKSPGEEDVSIVKGDYLYYHYLQDGFDDCGWGCAYRSLQTIFSWYKLQGWSDKEAPTHGEIQRALIDMGDKPETFYGSKQWIGSVEVSYVLDAILDGVLCRTLTIQKGESISEYAYEIANHFKKNGSPIMIGGGVLAHTILGVYIDEIENIIKFLVLDPHYIGSDNVSTICGKGGGVGWKEATFWKKDAFYNLCLPQRKTGV